MPLLNLKQLVSSSNYRDKLLDGRWEDFRKSYLRRNGSFCRGCRRGDMPIQIHHLVYDPSREPWEYNDNEVAALCRECHAKWHKLMNSFRLVCSGMELMDLQMLIGSLSVLLKLNSSRDAAFAIAQLASEPETLRRLKMSWQGTR